jgi:hypothetical protein
MENTRGYFVLQRSRLTTEYCEGHDSRDRKYGGCSVCYLNTEVVYVSIRGLAELQNYDVQLLNFIYVEVCVYKSEQTVAKLYLECSEVS